MSQLKGTVKVPIAGKVKKKELAVVGAIGAGALAYAYYRRATAAPVDEGPLEPVGDAVGLIENTPGYMSSGAPGLYGSASSDDREPGPGSFITNGQWHQYVVDYLERGGKERGAADTAVGLYLDHQKLTSAQADMIRIALGAAGRPPQGDYSIILATTGGVTQPTTPVTKPGAIRNLHVAIGEAKRSYLTWRWSAPTTGGPPSGYKLRLVSGTNTTVKSLTVGPGTFKYTSPTTLTANRPYRLDVIPFNKSGDGPRSSNVAHTAR